MQTLAVVDGDLVLNAGSILTISGPNKIKQDLYFALHEAYGADPYHPTWGTVLDQFIGLPQTPAVRQSAINEVSRVLDNYVAVQSDQINSYTATDNRSGFYASDVVRSVDSIDVQGMGPNIMITANLTTMAGQQLSAQREVGS